MDTVENLSNILQGLSPKQSTLLIAIDGCGGSGKSTLAKVLSMNLNNVTIVQMDDFYLPSSYISNKESKENEIGFIFDWQRLKNQVLVPLSENVPAKYQIYDWHADILSKWRTIEIGGIVIIEGVYSTRRELANFYDFRIWVECPRSIRLDRGIARDGEAARNRWEKVWMPLEDKYIDAYRPQENADLVVNGF